MSVRALSPTFTFPGEQVLRFELTLAADQLERFNVSVIPPLYRSAPDAEPLGGPRVEGSPLGNIREWAIRGGQPGPLVGVIDGLPTCSTGFNGQYHGYEPGSREQDLTLLAGSTATVTVGFDAGRYPLWPGMLPAPTFLLTNSRQDSAAGTLSREIAAMAPAPALEGPSGVRIDLWTEPQSSLAGRQPTATIAARRPVTIHLRTEPRLALARVGLQVINPDLSRRTLRTVRLNASGEATVRGWRPPREGLHELWATYSSARSDVADDYACPVAVTVATDPGSVTEAGTRPLLTAALLGVKRVTGGRQARIAVRCGLAELPLRCRGRATLLADGRPVLKRVVRIRSGHKRIFRWPVPAARRGSLRVTVRSG